MMNLKEKKRKEKITKEKKEEEEENLFAPFPYCAKTQDHVVA